MDASAGPGPHARGRARARAVSPGLPVLCISGYASDEILAGLDAPVLAKPFTQSDLTAAVGAALRAPHAPDAAASPDRGT